MINLTDIDDNCTVFFLFLSIHFYPFIKVTLSWNVSHSKWFNNQILIFWYAVEPKWCQFHDSNWLFQFMKNSWIVRFTWKNKFPVNLNFDPEMSQRSKIRTSEGIKCWGWGFSGSIPSEDIIVKNYQNFRYDVMSSNG